jgi:hypothetical protein
VQVLKLFLYDYSDLGFGFQLYMLWVPQRSIKIVNFANSKTTSVPILLKYV